MAHSQLGSFLIAFLPNGLPNWKWQAVKQHLDDHVGTELETSRAYSEGAASHGVRTPNPHHKISVIRDPAPENLGALDNLL